MFATNTAQTHRWFTVVNPDLNLKLNERPTYSRMVKIKQNMFEQLKKGLLSGVHRCIYVYQHDLSVFEIQDLQRIASFMHCELSFQGQDELNEQLSFPFDSDEKIHLH